jgi:hypothetical protein
LGMSAASRSARASAESALPYGMKGEAGASCAPRREPPPPHHLLALRMASRTCSLRAAHADVDMVQTPILGLFLAFVGRRAHMQRAGAAHARPPPQLLVRCWLSLASPFPILSRLG